MDKKEFILTYLKSKYNNEYILTSPRLTEELIEEIIGGGIVEGMLDKGNKLHEFEVETAINLLIGVINLINIVLEIYKKYSDNIKNKDKNARKQHVKKVISTSNIDWNYDVTGKLDELIDDIDNKLYE
jgi:hypothetical protein